MIDITTTDQLFRRRIARRPFRTFWGAAIWSWSSDHIISSMKDMNSHSMSMKSCEPFNCVIVHGQGREIRADLTGTESSVRDAHDRSPIVHWRTKPMKWRLLSDFETLPLARALNWLQFDSRVIEMPLVREIAKRLRHSVLKGSDVGKRLDEIRETNRPSTNAGMRFRKRQREIEFRTWHPFSQNDVIAWNGAPWQTRIFFLTYLFKEIMSDL
jgi:hypothetical protein